MLISMHPLPKLVLCLLWIVAALVVFRLSFQIALFAVATLVLLFDARIPLRRLLGLMVPFALFGFGFLTTSVLFRAESGFAVLMAQEQGGAPEVAPGLVLFFRVMACGMISAVFALTTDPGQFVRALMQHLRLPAPMGFALMQAMHMVPDLRAELLQMRMARAIRLGRPLRRVPTPPEALALAIPLLAYAIRRATRAALSFEARGLRPGRVRSQLPQAQISRADWMRLFAGIGGLALLLAMAPQGLT
ncbi:energy-coupling factor transporter transmembrane component T family protein [Jannaschia seohaensis]|uniref:Energy-coupling factor transport system permease protein n=1 Tax=Jannaschia seohaensis TaxID=475081 RepID=A0A2Y9APD2_9RHOB|nr:energy-coupling factor transporter transmembrane component T [Jannaschia seohaensis]PWJ19333.1 energy-coupling factor transport system permease protein [Jannaschia seohaensis]SSA45995.1 energy-coupling factor transport system permease protein [Jannaschia seohaensis]